jgi:hypothetical protein
MNDDSSPAVLPGTNHVTAEELERSLPSVLAAPRTDTTVALLCSRPDYKLRTFPERLELSRELGVVGDFEMGKPWLKLPDGRPDPRIQVSLLPLRVLDLVWRNRATVAHPGDQIVADLNMSTDNLPPGTLLKVGSATLRVSDLWNDGCARWRVRYGRAALNWVARPDHERLRLRGILCSIERDGVVALRDPICKL